MSSADEAKVVTAGELPEFEGHGPAAEVWGAVKRQLESYRTAREAIETDPRTPREGRPALRTELAMKARAELVTQREALEGHRRAVELTRQGHQVRRKSQEPLRDSAIWAALQSMGIGERHAVVARGIEAGDTDLLHALVHAPRVLGLTDDTLRARAADAFDPKTAGELRELEQAAESAELALKIAEREIGRDVG